MKLRGKMCQLFRAKLKLIIPTAIKLVFLIKRASVVLTFAENNISKSCNEQRYTLSDCKHTIIFAIIYSLLYRLSLLGIINYTVRGLLFICLTLWHYALY